MSKYNYDLIVIGGGSAGLTAATFSGQSSAKTLLIEKENKLGGDCLHYGCVPSKSLIKSSYAYNVIKNSTKYGLPEIKVPRVDYKKVSSRIQNIINTVQDHDSPEYLSKHYNVETKFGQPSFIDSHTISLNGENITSRYFVVAAGSSPVIPPIEGIETISYITNRDIFSLDELPESLIVLGGGPIGCEMAQAFRRLGSEVSILQSPGQLLPKEDPDVAAIVRKKLEDEGIKVYLNARAIKVEKKDELIHVTAKPKYMEGEQKVISGKTILVSTGRKPNIEGLALENAGIAFDKKGIKVDGRMRTTVKNIYACGDVNGGLQFTHVASYEAVVAIYNAILKIPKTADYKNVPWCTYLDPEIASIGYNEKRASEEKIKYAKQVDYFVDNDRALAEGETKGFIKILIDSKGKPIGVQIVGYHAGDLISEWVPILNGKVSLSTISNAIHAYPTMSEINKNASVNYLVSNIPHWTKKLTKILFGYQGKA